jgi:hypothetical protein
VDLRFDGWIAGVGTTSGHRFVIGMWPRSPFGPFADVMHEDPAGHRTLTAPSARAGEFIAATYRFDHVSVAPVAVRPVDGGAMSGPLAVTAGDLQLTVTVGRRSAVGWLLRAVPPPLARSTAWVSAIDAPARVILRGVRTRGTAGGDRREWYAALDNHLVVAAGGRLGGTELGSLAAVRPPVRFGFGSVPSRPSLTRVVTTVRVP